MEECSCATLNQKLILDPRAKRLWHECKQIRTVQVDTFDFHHGAHLQLRALLLKPTLLTYKVLQRAVVPIHHMMRTCGLYFCMHAFADPLRENKK